ncbi:MAG: hemolysin family protein [Planctomycetota bacterium]
MMDSVWFWFLLSATGFLLSSVGGLGAELLDSFTGRALEAFCRVKRNRERFASVFDHQDAAIRGSEYLRMIGTGMFLISGTAAFFVSRLSEDGAASIGSMVFSWAVLAIVAMMAVHAWLPEVVTRVASAPVLYYTWPFWRSLASAMNPFSIPGLVINTLTRRLSGQEESEDEPEEILEDEIRTIVAAGTNKGIFGPGVREMIQNVMELDEDTVGHIMTVRGDIDAVEIEAEWPEVMRQVERSGRTRLPVFEGTLDNVVGVLYVKDLLPELSEGSLPKKTLRQLLRHAWTVPVDRTVDSLLREFLHSRSHMAIVLDEFQQTAGVVTIEDALEEIVGEIVDESDEEEETKFEVIDDQTVVVSGRVMIDDLNDRLHWELPESDDYETVAGFVLSHLGQIPETGAKFEIGVATFEVLHASRQKIETMRVTHAPQDRLAG